MSDPTIIDKSPMGRYMCFKEILGRGAYKIVYRAYDTHNGIEVAWNSISIQMMNENDQKIIIKEINMLKELSPHNNFIVKFFNAWINPEKKVIVFITEIALSGTLFDYIKKINKINMRVIKKWAHQILDALAFLHERNIAHRDLKCSNIFINSNTGNIMLGDFGLATKGYSTFHSILGTPEYMAPEMYEKAYNEKVDIYAFGCCLIEMITKEVPYSECESFAQIYRKVSRGELPEGIYQIKSSKAKNLITQCLVTDPEKRPTAQQLLKDPFLNILEVGDNDDTLVKKTSSMATSESSSDTQSDDDIDNFKLDTQESIDGFPVIDHSVDETNWELTEESDDKSINVKRNNRDYLLRLDINYVDNKVENQTDDEQAEEHSSDE
jgi:WNK lysine deficient protein kinase